MGESARQHRHELERKAAPPPQADVPVPGRETRVGGSRTTNEGAVVQQLRTAIGALTQIRTTWIPALQQQAPDDMTVVNAQAALRRAEHGITLAVALNDTLGSTEVEKLLQTAKSERDQLSPQLNALFVGGDVVHAQVPQQAPPPLQGQPPPPPPPPPVVAAPSYDITWEDIRKGAEGDAASLKKLDTDWIDGVNHLINEGVDQAFHRSHIEAAFQKSVDENSALLKAKRELVKAKNQVVLDARADGKKANDEARKLDPKAKLQDLSGATLAKDPEVKKKQEALQAKYDADRAAQIAALRTAYDKNSTHRPNTQVNPYSENVVQPPTGVTNAEGRLLSRANFMAWGIHVFGSADSLKKHYKGMKSVTSVNKSHPPLLAAAAADRLDAAVTWFKAKYPGNRFHETDVGFGLRNAHNEGRTMSYLGHAMGYSIDFWAVHDPSFLDLDANKDGSIGRYMLKRFGNTDTKRAEARIHIKLPNSAYKDILQMGKDTAAGKDPSTGGQAVLDAAKNYDEMTATSDRFRASQTANMKDLIAAKTAWIEISRPLTTKLKTAKAAYLQAVQKATTAAGKDATTKASVKAAKSPDDAKKVVADFVDANDGVKAAKAAVAKVEEDIKTQTEIVTKAIDKAFGPWIKQLEAEIKVLETPPSDADKAIAKDVKAIQKVLDQIAGAKTVADLHKILDDKKSMFDADAMKKITDLEALRNAMRDRLEGLRSMNPEWNKGEIFIRKGLIKKLSTGAGVFGTDIRMGDKGWYMHKSVNAPPVFQLLDIGFAAHDELADATKEPGRLKSHEAHKEVFNKEFIETMMRFGWAPLGAQEAFLDTMHFDFLEGWETTAKGAFAASGKLGPKSKG